MRLANKITIGAALAVLVLAVVGIIYGSTTHSEPGLMRACWHSGTVIDYHCAAGEELTWDRRLMPLSVVTDGALPETQTAIDLVNSQVGCDLLEYAEDTDPQPDVSITSESTMISGGTRSGSTWHVRDARGMRARIDLYNTGDLTLRVIVHELGHALGLDHDTFTGSIMYPRQTDTRGMQFIRISDADRQTLRDLYCRN